MNKIFLYCLGVLYFIKGSVCSAIEKFEVLPDLPDPLAYAVQPANAASVSGTSDLSVMNSAQTIGQDSSIFSVVLSLIFVILLIYVTGIIYAKLNKVGFKTLKRQQGDFARNQVSVVSTTQLGNNKTLHVVELDGKRMLIGAAVGAIQLIKDLGSIQSDDDSEYSHIEIPNIKIPKIEIPKIEIPSIGFSKLVTKTHKPLKEDIEENVESEKMVDNASNNEDSSPSVVENNEEISDGIIDSLFAQQAQIEPETVVDNSSLEHIVDPEDFALYKKYLS